MPDQGTLLRIFLTLGLLFGLPLLFVALTQLRRSRWNWAFLLATGVPAALFAGGLLWLLLLFAPPTVPCAPSTPEVQAGDAPCALGSLGLHRGWPVVDAALGGLVGLSLTVAMLAYRRRRSTAASVEYLVRDVLDRVR